MTVFLNTQVGNVLSCFDIQAARAQANQTSNKFFAKAEVR